VVFDSTVMASTTSQVRSLALMTTFFVVLALCSHGAEGRILRFGCPCGETYVVRGGESLQMISEKCNDQFILENNPHIVDHDDLYDGQLLRMDCTQRKINLCDVAGVLPSYFC